MTYQEALPDLIDEAYNELFKNAERIKDKLDYKAAESNRTPMEMLVECATVPPSLAKTIRARAMPNDAGEMHATDGLDSIEACRSYYESVKGELFEAIRSFPEEMLTQDIATPWGTFKWRDFMAYAYWNPMYHTGQLAYIQMIHGDTSMDF